MGLKDYEFQGSTWQFEEGQEPEGAFVVDGPALADSVFIEIDEAARADVIEAEKAAEQAVEAARVADELEAAETAAAEKAAADAVNTAAEKAAAGAAKQKTPQNKAVTPATK